MATMEYMKRFIYRNQDVGALLRGPRIGAGEPTNSVSAGESSPHGTTALLAIHLEEHDMSQVSRSQGKNIEVNGTTLWVEDTGESDLPVVLCLHSCFLDGTMFDGLVQAAAGKFRVVRPDFRGQGKSALDDVDIITMDKCADDMEALIGKMGLKSI